MGEWDGKWIIGDGEGDSIEIRYVDLDEVEATLTKTEYREEDNEENREEDHENRKIVKKIVRQIGELSLVDQPDEGSRFALRRCITDGVRCFRLDGVSDMLDGVPVWFVDEYN